MRLYGSQAPRILVVPESAHSRGKIASELASEAGLGLDPWQQKVLQWGLGVDVKGQWSSFEVGLICPRQNGKGAILEALELFWLFESGEKLILHSAHEFPTAQEHFLRVLALIESSDYLLRQVKRVRTSHGEEGIELLNGSRLRFKARSKGSGRGFSADKVVWDEAFNLPDTAVEAMLPTLSARQNPQIWYTSSSPDKDLAPCEPLGRLRERALDDKGERLTYAEWSIEPHFHECPSDCQAHDEPSNPRSWAKANPGFNIRITEPYVAREMEAMSPVGFARERLGVGNWPSPAHGWEVISEEIWAELENEDAEPLSPVVFAADVTPERSFGSIAVSDGAIIEVVDHQRGTHWMVKRIIELDAKYGPTAWIIDPSGPSNSLISPLEAAEINVVKPSARQMTAACGLFYERATDAKTLQHRGQPELAVALSGCKKRDLGHAWAWGRRGQSVDISPLVASTLALWGHTEHAPQPEEPKTYYYEIPEPEKTDKPKTRENACRACGGSIKPVTRICVSCHLYHPEAS